MANTRDIKAGAAYVELYMQNNRFVRGLRLAEQQLKASGAKMQAIGMKMFAVGGAIAGAMFLTAKSFASAGDELDKMSARVGTSVEFLSALGYAAELGGTDISTMENSIRRLQRAAYDAATVGGTTADAFKTLGVSVTDASGQLKATEELFMESATALSRWENESEKAALSTILFGRAGTQLLPMLREGAEGLAEMTAEAKRLNLVVTTEEASAAAVLTDQMARMSRTIKMVVFQIGSAVAGPFGALIDKIREAAKVVVDWVKENRALMVSVLKIAGVAMAAGAGMIALGAAVTGTGMALGAVATIISMVGSGLGLVASAAAALLTPIGAVAAAVIGLTGYLVTVSGTGGQAIKWLGERFEELKKIAVETFKGISDALAGGDVKLAAEIFWATLEVTWTRGVNTILEIWDGLRLGMLDILDQIKVAAQTKMEWLWANIAKLGIFWAGTLKGKPQSQVEDAMQGIERRYQAKASDIRDDAGAAKQDRELAFGAKLNQREAELNRLLQERQRLFDTAREGRGTGEPGDYPVPGKRKQDKIVAGAGNVAAMGTFSARAAALFGQGTAGGPAERAAKASETMSAATKELVTKAGAAIGHLSNIAAAFVFGAFKWDD